jgi:hypothetical protein
MKKFFIALSVLAALMLSVVPSQALVGMPDDQMGSDAVVPFICNTSLTGLNTLIVFTDAATTNSQLGRASWRARVTGADIPIFHYNVSTIDSVTIYNNTLTGSPNGMTSIDAINLMGNLVADASVFEVTIDSVVYYAGYIYFDNLSSVAAGTNVTSTIATADSENGTVGQWLLVDIPDGWAAMSNVPMKENAANDALEGTVNGRNVGAVYADEMYDAPGAGGAISDDTFMELFSANALANAERAQQNADAGVNATFFGLTPRYYNLAATGSVTNGNSWLIIWKSTLTEGTVIDATTHVNFWDTAENAASSNLDLSHELNIISLETGIIPGSLFDGTEDAEEGWIDCSWATSSADLRRMQILGWTYLQATSTAADAWSALAPMQRWVNYAGSP